MSAMRMKRIRMIRKMTILRFILKVWRRKIWVRRVVSWVRGVLVGFVECVEVRSGGCQLCF